MTATAIAVFHPVPLASKAFQRWLDPLDPVGLRVSLTGAAVVEAGHLVTSLVSATIKAPQFWDYGAR